jgi:ubiquinone/menaquinone biosynthesis C-methylase UbiE
MSLLSGIIRGLQAFAAINRKVCSRVGAFLPQAKVDIFSEYTETVASLLHGRPYKAIVIDVGGGKECPFARIPNGAGNENSAIIAADVCEEELRHNHDVDGKVVADIVRGLPFRTHAADLITSRSVLEHIEDVGRFVGQATEVLKLDGYWIHLFPSKFAPFALINQLLPKSISKALVYFFLPGFKGICGFPAAYDKCYYSAMRKLLVKNGFELVEVKTNYYQSPYFDFCFPLFAVSAAYEVLVRLLGLKNLAAYVLVVARRTRA